MKILTNGQYDRLVERLKSEGFESGYKEGRGDGYKNGLHAGLIAEKEGIYMGVSGLYTYKGDGEMKEVVSNAGYDQTSTNQSN